MNRETENKEKTCIIEMFRIKTDEMFHSIEGMDAREIENMVWDFIQTTIDENSLDAEIVDVVILGSRCRGLEKIDSDLDAVLEYKGNIREDTFFDILQGTEMKLGRVNVDIKPITEGKTGTLGDYLLEIEKHLEQKLSVREKRYSVIDRIKRQKDRIQSVDNKQFVNRVDKDR